MSEKTIYLIPGRGEKLTNGIGQIIARMGFTVHGREIILDFARLGFSEQLSLIHNDLESGFWHSNSMLIGYSFGAYLLLHTLAEMESFSGKILLFSPVLGAGISQTGYFGSIPPRAKKLLKLAESGKFPTPQYLEIHTGAEDSGCDPVLAERFASSVKNTKLYIIADVGHQLEEKYLRGVVESFWSTRFRV